MADGDGRLVARPRPRCAACGDVIGVYEPAWFERDDDGALHRSSLLNVDDAEREQSFRVWHVGCAIDDFSPAPGVASTRTLDARSARADTGRGSGCPDDAGRRNPALGADSGYIRTMELTDRAMRSRDFRPSPQPPVSDRDLERYAGKWVVVREGKVVLQASGRDALIAALVTSGRITETDAILHLPPRDIAPR